MQVLADPPQSVRQRLVGDWLMCFTLAPRKKPFITCVVLFVPFPMSLQHRSHPFMEVNVRVVEVLVLASPYGHALSVMRNEAGLSGFRAGFPFQHFAASKPRIGLGQHLPTEHLAAPVFEQLTNNFMQLVGIRRHEFSTVPHPGRGLVFWPVCQRIHRHNAPPF
jgi:hypothetical protein